MDSYIVLYRDKDALVGDPPLGFRCEAEDYDHAEEQGENAYPEASIIWIWKGRSMQDALDDYRLAWQGWEDLDESDVQAMQEDETY